MSERVYLLLGPEAGAKEQELKDIRNQLRSEYGEVELSRFYPFETEQGQIFTILNNNSLFSDYRLVILGQAESSNAALVQGLVEYLKHPADSATLVIVSSELSVSDKLMKLIPKQNTKVYYDLLEGQKADWIRTYFRKMGLSITGDAVDLLIDITEDNTQELRTICSQLGLFWQIGGKNRPIEEEDIENYIQHSRQEDAFTLFTHIARCDLKQSLKSLQAMLGSGDSQTPVLLVNGLVWQFRRLLSVAEEVERGTSENDALAKAHVFGKAMPVRKPKDRTTYHQALSAFDTQAIRSIIVALAQADIKVKDTSGDLTTILLERLLYQIIKSKGKRVEEAPFATF